MKRTKTTKTMRRTKAADIFIILLTAAVLFLFAFISTNVAGKTEEIDHYALVDERIVPMTGYQTLNELKNNEAGNPFSAGADKSLWNVMNIIILTGGMAGLTILYLSDAASMKAKTSKKEIYRQNPG